MKIALIIPTYNEAESINSLIHEVQKELKEMGGHVFHILVVDANSPDGTKKIVEELKKEYPNLEVISEEKKRGLGAAYISGMKYAMEKMSAEAIMEFDGDFQHDPKDIKKLVKGLEEGFDYIIGSRYVPGGSIPEEWSFYRKFLSKYGSLFIKLILGLTTKDNTSGFKLSRVKNYAERMPLSEGMILSLLHAYKIHLLYEMMKLEAKTKEVPIRFLERKNGSSKNTARDIFESLKVVLILRLRFLFR